MGVGFFVGDEYQAGASFNYGSFSRFRRELAAHEGFDLGDMQGFGGQQLPWRGIRTPLRPLLHHADDTGRIGPRNCARVAARLREVIPEIYPYASDGRRLRAEALALAMERAAERGTPLIFS